jgi:hypothetical protein
MIFGFATVEHVDTTVTSRRAYLMISRFVRISQLETVETMTATMGGSLRCNAIQLHEPSLVITLHEVKYVSELWVK